MRRVPLNRGSKRLRPLGKKGKEWASTRVRLVREFAAKGIISCELGYEGCWKETVLGFAHGKKRRMLLEGELHDLTILACLTCHNVIEFMPAEQMLAIVQSVIAKRKR